MDFIENNMAFRQLGIIQDAAECHGLLCGLLCTRGAVSRDEWLTMLCDEDTTTAAMEQDSDHAAAWAVVQNLYQQTLAQLQNTAFSFQLLLPDDEQSLSSRVTALGDWCMGFLFGLGVEGSGRHLSMPADAQEIIRDFVEISRAYHDEEEEYEVSESSYMEVVEYVRVGAILIYEELLGEEAPETQQDNDGRVLH